MVFTKTSPVLHETVSKAPLLADFNHEQEEFIKSKGGKEQVHMASSNPVIRKLNVCIMSGICTMDWLPGRGGAQGKDSCSLRG